MSNAEAPRHERWCGICFAWRVEHDGRCASCGNAHMTGESIPRPEPDLVRDDYNPNCEVRP